MSAWTDGTVLGVVRRLVFLDAMICSHTYPLSLIEMLVLLLCREYFVNVQETFRSCSDISVSRPPRSVDQQEGLLKLRVMKRLIEVMKKREKVRAF